MLEYGEGTQEYLKEFDERPLLQGPGLFKLQVRGPVSRIISTDSLTQKARLSQDLKIVLRTEPETGLSCLLPLKRGPQVELKSDDIRYVNGSQEIDISNTEAFVFLGLKFITQRNERVSTFSFLWINATSIGGPLFGPTKRFIRRRAFDLITFPFVKTYFLPKVACVWGRKNRYIDDPGMAQGVTFKIIDGQVFYWEIQGNEIYDKLERGYGIRICNMLGPLYNNRFGPVVI